MAFKTYKKAPQTFKILVISTASPHTYQDIDTDMLRSQYFGRRNDRSPTKTKPNKQTTKKQNLLSLVSLILTELSYHYVIPLKKYDSKNNDSF